jgi:hypothetical protein
MGISAHEEPLQRLLFTNMNLYEVPIYQRNYSWEAEQVSALWEDILRTARGTDVYFLGSMVFVKTGQPNVYQILDGQQRFATLSLLMAAFRSMFRELVPESPYIALTESTLTALDLNGNHVCRLRLNDRDRPFFEPLAMSGVLGSPQHSSHKLLRRSYEEFTNKLEGLIEGGEDPSLLWAQLMRTFADRLYIIRIEVDDLESAQQIFEALNSAGLDLTQADLIKNYLLREAPEPSRHDAYLTWMSVADAVEEDSALTTYIRTLWNSSHGFARKSELYKRLKERVKATPLSSEEITPSAFVSQLNDEVQSWLAIRDAQVPAGTPFQLTASLRDDLQDLKAFNAVLVHVPLMAIRSVSEESPADYARAVRWLRDFFVRNTIVGRRASNQLEIRFSEWAREIRAGRMSLAAFYEELVRQSPTDEEFELEFKSLNVRTQKVARVLLARINDHVNPSNVITNTMIEGGSVHLEHIIPQQPDEEGWAPTLARLAEEGLDHEDVLNNIGNLTLLRPADNIGISNRSFELRKSAYEQRDEDGNPQPAPINVYLTQIDEFGLKELRARQEWLAARAREVWALAP